ncbi:MAG: sigma-70 family RNA polymerase sigma factor [Pseudomonadota bacterium]|nr:sigma-70 family RNA polymerase sigma factor [Pseudomonadota bacterium]
MAITDDLRDYFGERRPDLVRFAALQLRDPALAEDVVQETLAAALQGSAKFGGRSSVKTWVFSILKRKIIDALRARRREVPASQVGNACADDQGYNELFDERGFWATEHRPHRWTAPAESLEQEQFWQIFELCLDRLPERTAQVFSMRDSVLLPRAH